MVNFLFRCATLALCLPLLAFSVDDDPQKNKDPFQEDLPKVEAATLHSQTLDEAPADVTVITREEIRVYGYRTLVDALAAVRGFYTSNDHMYSYTGVGGFSLPGDNNTGFLVMINGHPMTENIYSSNNYFEQDFGLDMDLVQRIEVVRGPSSALFGSNGILATINVVTISPIDFAKNYATVEAGSFGQKKAMIAGSYYLGKGANLLISASVVNNAGENLYFAELDLPRFGGGHAINMDGERVYHTFANLVWRHWNVMAYFNGREKKVPLAWDYDANSFFSRGNHVNDSRNFLSAVYSRSLGPGDLRWESSYDNYRYADRFDFIGDSSMLERRSYADGDWLTTRLNYRLDVGVFGTLTSGVEASVDLRNLQYDREIYPLPLEFLSISRPGRSAAIFLQDEKRLSPRWSVDLGVRLDEHRYYGAFVSPRLAVDFQASPRTTYKFIYGRSFRDPSAFEQFYYDDIAFLQSAPLRPETANTFELVANHHFSRGISGVAKVFDYRLSNLIQAVYLDNGASTFENVVGSRSQGVEFELGGKPRAWLETAASFSWQHAVEDGSGLRFANSPAYLAKFRWAAPAGRRVTVSNEWLWLSSRLTFAGDVMRPVLSADLTLTVQRLPFGVELQCGLRNALNWAYQDPVGLSLDEIAGQPRSLFVKFVWNPEK